MPRVKRGVHHVRRRTNILKKAKGYRWGRKNKLKLAQTAIMKANAHARKDRRLKKRDMRGLWLIKLNAALRLQGTTYSKFIGALKKGQIELDRKVLAEIAEKQPEVFAKIVSQVK